MRCLYCETNIHTSPESGTCPNCGGKLPKPAQQQFTRPLRTCCPMCYSRDISFKKRGFSWGWGLLGFFLFPFLGALFGFIGYKKLRFRCHTCSYK